MKHPRKKPSASRPPGIIPESSWRETFWSSVLDPDGLGVWRPATDVYELPDRYKVVMELAGALSDRIRIRMEGQSLVISGSRETVKVRPPARVLRLEIPAGDFERKFSFRARVAAHDVRSEIREGYLVIDLPKDDLRDPEQEDASI